MDCMLSEERIEALIEQLMRCIGGSGESLEEVIRRFFAPPPGSVRVEVAVQRCDGIDFVAVTKSGKMKLQEMQGDSHRCTAIVYVPPVPPTPVVEVVS